MIEHRQKCPRMAATGRLPPEVGKIGGMAVGKLHTGILGLVGKAVAFRFARRHEEGRSGPVGRFR